MANQIIYSANIAPANAAIEVSINGGTSFAALAFTTVGSLQQGTLPNVPAGAYAIGQLIMGAVGYPATRISNTIAVTVSAPAAAAAASSSYSFVNNQFFDNGTNIVEADHTRRNEYASVEFDHTGTALSVVGTNTMSVSNGLTTVLVVVNGTLFQALNFANTGALQTLAVNTLPTGTKRVRLLAGQGEYASGVRKGNFLQGMITDSSVAFAAPSAPATRVVGIFDSIGSGNNVPNPGLGGLPGLLRASFPTGYRLTCEGGSGAALMDDITAAADADAFVARLVPMFDGTTANILYIQRSTNDAVRYTTSAFSAAAGIFLDKFRAAMPAARVVWSTATTCTQTPYSTNAQSFRDAITALGTTRSWLEITDGTTLISASNLDTDGLHLTAAGQQQFATNLLPKLVPAAVAAPAAFAVPAASALLALYNTTAGDYTGVNRLDTSGAGHTMTQTGATLSTKANGRTVTTYAGTGGGNATVAYTGGDFTTVFDILLNSSSTAGNNAVFSLNNSCLLFYGSNVLQTYDGGFHPLGAIPAGAFGRVIVNYNSAAKTADAWLNGAVLATAVTWNVPAATGLQAGEYGSSLNLNGQMGVLALYNRLLTSAERDTWNAATTI